MLAEDLCEMSVSRAEHDQHARDIRLGLERIEQLLVRRNEVVETGPKRKDGWPSARSLR